jgi:hypothetical protein
MRVIELHIKPFCRNCCDGMMRESVHRVDDVLAITVRTGNEPVGKKTGVIDPLISTAAARNDHWMPIIVMANQRVPRRIVVNDWPEVDR